MRAFSITAPGHGEVVERPKPTPGPGEAVVKVAYCGICGTDYHIFRGDFLEPKYPLTNGHEFSGTLDAIGGGVTGWREGDRVAVDPTLTCGQCYYCLRRQANHCEDWGATGDTATGALAEYVLVPARNLYRVPDGEPLDIAAFSEPLACVVWGVERLRLTPGDSVLIFGAGPIGGAMTGLLALGPASDITVVDTMAEKLEVARVMGATGTFVSGPELHGQLMDRTHGRGYDVVIDCTGIASVVEGMFAYAGPVAKIMVFGVSAPTAQVSVKPFDVYHKDWTILGSMAINYTFQQARDLLEGGRFDARPLLTTVAGLDDVAGILGRPKSPTELKTLIAPNPV